MISQPISKTFDIGDGRQITIETGKLARQADGSVTVRQGNCIILATVVAIFFSSFSRLPGEICLCRPDTRFVF